MLLSINQLSELTGRERHIVAKLLRDLPFKDGERGAHLYQSVEALPVIYGGDSLDAARAKQALSQARLNAVREQELRRQRIPLEIVADAMDQTFQSIAATLKAAKNKKLTTERINELFDKFRDMPEIVNYKNGNGSSQGK
jgi:hypothetical protein